MRCEKHPEKVGIYRSERAAKAALRRIKDPQGAMRVYPCGGHFHFGHGDALDTSAAINARRTQHKAATGPRGHRVRGGGNTRRHLEWALA